MNFEPKGGDFEKLAAQLSQSGNSQIPQQPAPLGQTPPTPGNGPISGNFNPQNPNNFNPAQRCQTQSQPRNQVRQASARVQSQQAAQAQAKTKAQSHAQPQAQAHLTDASDPLHPRRTGFKVFMFIITFLVVLGCTVDRDPELLTFWMTWLFVFGFAIFFFSIFYLADRSVARKQQSQSTNQG